MKKILNVVFAFVLAIAMSASLVLPNVEEADATSQMVTDAISWAKKVANNNKNGYSMPKRNQKNSVGGTEYDCSALVCKAYQQAGAKVSIGSTATMKSIFKKAGFEYIPASKLNYCVGTSKLKKGDVLWRYGHTELYIGNGKNVGAHWDYDGRAGDSSGSEIDVCSYYNNSWSGVFRYTSDVKKIAESSDTATTTTESPSSDNTNTAETSTEKSYDPTTKKTYYVGAYKVNQDMNLRSGADTSSNIIKVVKKNAKVEITKVKGRFGKTTYKNSTGWVSLKYATKQKDEKKKEEKKKDTEDKKVEEKKEESKTEATVSTQSSYDKTTKKTYYTGTYKLTGDVFMRKAANTSSEDILTLKAGTKVTATKVSGRFGYITYKGKTGWCSLRYATKTSTVTASSKKTTTTKKSTKTKTVKVSTKASNTKSSYDKVTKKTYYTGTYKLNGDVFMRKGASTKAEDILTLKAGKTVKVTKLSGRFGYITYKGKKGWVSLKFAKRIK